ncbi:tautomerase family protein [Sneathiella sp. P13V-1]|uniref:tautomerase family protein n=1 Tax=Sneathiella sp. P13V-1 TaxID=2697366 RepID=UPI00187BAD2D|nr:tautomerase family protein [Sneathiella sp. P13V-1]MBE7637393.1 tautomerase family protein [Sneathiella sp. P13V-1]
MPLVNISLIEGKSDSYRRSVMDNIYLAMRETFNVPEDDQFMTVNELSAANFSYNGKYLNVQRSQDLIYIQIFAMNTRNKDQKKALFQKIVERLRLDPGVRSEDILINIVEAQPENWSMGNGLAQYALAD